MDIGTNYVLADEPCFLLTELDLPQPHGPHRMRTTYVIRSDKIAKYVEDLGPSKQHKEHEVRILGGVKDDTTGRIVIEHSVGELRDIAMYLRHSNGNET